MYDIKRKPDETEIQYLWRLGQAKDSALIDLDWTAIAAIMNREFRTDETEYRTESAYRKRYTNAKSFNDAGVFRQNGEDNYMKELVAQKREIEKERKKLQTEKLEYNRWLRENARDELITEKICEAIATLPPLKSMEADPIMSDSYEINNKEYLLCLTDAHFGIEFCLKDLHGNIINEYSPEVFYRRMDELFSRVIEIVRRENIQVLNVWELGDGIQGILRLSSQLMKLRYGIIDSSIMYANYLANWLNDLTQYVHVNFQMVIDSNHNQLRICGAPKNAFVEENMSKVMLTLIRERLRDNLHFKIIENPTGMNYQNMCNYNILGIHGEVKNPETAADEFSRIHQIPIDYLIGGHVHYQNSKEIGINSEVIGVRSIIGVDPYGLSLRKASNAGASLYTFEEGRGLVETYSIKLF